MLQIEAPKSNQGQSFPFGSRQVVEARCKIIRCRHLKGLLPEAEVRQQAGPTSPQELITHNREGRDLQALAGLAGVFGPDFDQRAVNEIIGLESVLGQAERERPHGGNQCEEFSAQFGRHDRHRFNVRNSNSRPDGIIRSLV